jgi:hypothetical protein
MRVINGFLKSFVWLFFILTIFRNWSAYSWTVILSPVFWGEESTLRYYGEF